MSGGRGEMLKLLVHIKECPDYSVANILSTYSQPDIKGDLVLGCIHIYIHISAHITCVMMVSMLFIGVYMS